ncbi:outer membrane protein assembly factor BamB family protein [Streptomyces drozdowiczii]|uniref:PQQ-binding-like beta-propeller repeat protein n=1 Tax=Streptomyces drozdowiczii TaxID=202862 RepID=A0ABY6PV05_9ACTN|nr:PQQ-binding-like beta-propeller repeat protein [Streptomyces drozdowiczii]MCX0244304.1 PQQ-binding-like beta-propeller repeat protein [Streptomyces drozdowiczii]UZK55902.1 PQQ-binding-like beta-propeller repeat protein [Streptomyces drozdowiczii]
MSQPPGQQPPQGEFGAPYDPATGSPYGQQQQQPGYGYPPQGYGPPRPGPYTQPGLHQMPTQQQYPAPTPPPGGRFRGRTAKIVGAVVAVALLAGGGIWFATGGGDDDKPLAGPTHSAKPTVAPSPTKSGATGEPVVSPEEEARTINAGAEPGEAKVAWIQKGGIDLPRNGEDQFGPWFAGDVVVRALFNTVSGYSVSDGTRRWNLRLPSKMCAAPSQPTTDGRIVLGIRHDTAEDAECDTLQMVDLRTGKAGWHKSYVRKGVWDGLSDLAMAINGDTVTVGRTGRTEGFRVSDGKQLFGERPGKCQPFGLASGPVAIAAVSCHTADDQYKDHQLQRIDPATGKALWTYKLKKDWEVGQIYSVSPLVVSLKHPEKWAVLVLNADGSYRSQLSGGPGDYQVECERDLMSLGRNLDNCVGVAADANTFYMSTDHGELGATQANKIVAFDLSTGKFRWSADAPGGQAATPLRTEGGKLLMYVHAAKGKGGGIATLPSTGGTPRFVQRHPASGADLERGIFEPRVAYTGGRAVLTPSRLSGIEGDDEVEARSVVVYGG